MSHKIVVLDGIYANPGDLSWDPLHDFGDVTIYDRTTEDEVITRSEEASILIINKIKLGTSEFDQLPNLKLIIISATGMDNVDLKAAESRGIKVKNVSGYSTQSVAQHVFSLILAIYNKVIPHNDSVKNGDWDQNKGFSYLLETIPELTDKTLTIIGFGQIGSEVAKIGSAFGMKVLVVSDHSKSLDKYELVSLEEGFSKGDIISLHWPLTPEKKGIVNASLLNLMKPTGILVNTARGGLIKEDDLAHALRNNKPSFAALDVLTQEPPTTNHPLFQLSNCIITPHIAWASSRSRKILLDKVFEHVAHFTN